MVGIPKLEGGNAFPAAVRYQAVNRCHPRGKQSWSPRFNRQRLDEARWHHEQKFRPCSPFRWWIATSFFWGNMIKQTKEKHVAVIGGIGPQATLEFYRRVILHSEYVPFLSMIDLVVREVSNRNYKKVDLLGASVALHSGLYRKPLKKKSVSCVLLSRKQMGVLDIIIKGILGS